MSNKIELVGNFNAASGANFSVFQNSTRFPVFDNLRGQPCGHAGSFAKAWDSVRYLAKIHPVTMRTDDNKIDWLMPVAAQN